MEWFNRWRAWASAQLHALTGPDADGELDEFERSRLTMAIYRGNLEIRRVGVSYALDITFRSLDPQEAALVANATAEAFVREQLEAKSEAVREGSAWLERRIKELRAQMNVATQIAQQFRARHDYRVDTVSASRPRRRRRRRARRSRVEDQNDQPTLEELEANADTYRRMYESFLQAFTSSVHQQSYPVADARVITSATPPLAPSQPRKKLVWAFGALAGIVAGTGLAFARELLDRTVRSASQIREQLGLECLGELPSVLGRRRGFGRFDEVIRAPRSAFSDNVGRIRTAITLADPGPLRCLGIISALPDEGKSGVASNLAIAFAAAGRRTLLIDADIHHAELTANLVPNARLAASPEISDQVEKGTPSLVPLPGRYFDLLPSWCLGSARGSVPDPAEVQVLLNGFRSYDMIIVDLAPLMSSVDGLAVSTALDGVVIVAQCGRTTLDLLTEVSRSLTAARVPVAGVVMTMAQASTAAYRRQRRASLRVARNWPRRLILHLRGAKRLGGRVRIEHESCEGDGEQSHSSIRAGCKAGPGRPRHERTAGRQSAARLTALAHLVRCGKSATTRQYAHDRKPLSS